jgi:hypothetical protein
MVEHGNDYIGWTASRTGNWLGAQRNGYDNIGTNPLDCGVWSDEL